ncbi:MAG: M23 family metallopeptidase [Verrucomicrobiae bacterium]|nr:M23 family metallopeptidase [Verrucomicrobiae bacterium]
MSAAWSVAGRARCELRARWLRSVAVLALLGAAVRAPGQPFHLPTANRALFESGGGERFLVGTTGKPWTSGGFGCVRSDGRQFHEGLDIRSVERDRHGEPLDPVLATADGVVAYINRRPSLSNYGNYIVLGHRVHGLEVYSLYAHLREVSAGLKPGHPVTAGQALGVMGRTANTREGISRERAHVHFELDLLVNERFEAWFRHRFPKQRNDHGVWNGQNLVGLDPQQVFLEQRRLGARFNLLRLVQNQTELCRVFVRATQFPWLRRYAALVRSNPRAEREGVAGYEVALTFNGLPFELIPRSAAEVGGGRQAASKGSRFLLLSVNEAEAGRNPCGKLVTRRGGRWELTWQGQLALERLTY